MPELNLLKAVNLALHQEMRRDERVVVYGEDVGYEGGVFRATEGLQKEFGSERCMDSPLSESAIVGTAVGMAINGMIPVVEMQFGGFVYPAFNQILSHVARMRNRSRGRYTVPMVIRFPYGGGIRALEHHSESMEALFAHIPGLKVVIPSTPYDAKGLLSSAIRSPDPVIFMEPKRIYRAFKQEVPESDYQIPIGKAKVEKEGTDITLISWGAMMQETRNASKILSEKGVSAEVIDLRTISPYDSETIVRSVKKTGRVVIIHEETRSFGTGAELITMLTEKAFLHLEAPPARVTGFSTIIPLPKGEQHYMPSVGRIVMKAMETVQFLT
jgi:pyruvate dehydrogenase E1 component beta subunit